MCKQDKYINIKTGKELDLDMINGLKDNSALKTNPQIWLYWDFESNHDLNIFNVTKGSKIKCWWYCKQCDDAYPQRINSKVKNAGCSICKGTYVTVKNSFGGKFKELAKEWHPTKNGDKSPSDYSYGSGQKVWWKCPKCYSDYDMTIDKRTSQNARCPYCRGLRINEFNNLSYTHPELVIMWDYNKNGNIKPENFVKGNKTKVYWKCNKCGDESYTSISNKTGCSVCAGQKIIKGLNDINTTNPKLASLLLNTNDKYKYGQFSNVNVDWKCDNCGEILKNKKISDISKNGFKCKVCSDGMSFGERVIYIMLKELDISFEYEKVFVWENKRRYDFYISTHDLIIEVHGEQHYNGSFSKIGGRTLEEETENDIYKKEIAIKNGIKNYIEIRSNSLNLSKIKTEIINSNLMELLNISYDFIKKFKLDINHSLIKECWILWNSTNYGVMKIAKELNLSKSVIRKYLILGDELGKCKYSVRDRYDRLKRKIVKLTMESEFIKCYDGLIDASNELNIKLSSTSINKDKTAYGYRWMYLDDYEKEYGKLS